MINLGIITAQHYPRLGGMEFTMHFLAQQLNAFPSVNVSVACNSLTGVPKNYNYPYACYRSKSLSYLTPWLFRYNQEHMIKKENINLLHGPMLHGGGLWATELGKQYKLPVVAHSHGSDVQVVKEIGYGALLDKTHSKSVKKVINNATHLIAVSSINAQQMIDLGAKPEKVSVIHNGLHIDAINAIPYKDMRTSWGLSLDDFIIICVGRNKPVKRMDLLFKALKKLEEYKNIKCVCVGPTNDLPELITKHGLESKVILIGSIPKDLPLGLEPPFTDLINAYRSSNLYVSTSYVEAFGNAAAEALACGIPVLVGKKHGIKDVINAETGWEIVSETPGDLAEQIVVLYKNRQSLLNARESIKASVSKLSWKNAALQMAEVYKTVM